MDINEEKIKNIETAIIILQDNQKKISENILNILNNDEIIGNCKKMGEHIDFIEKIYEHVKYPLSYVCNKINNTNRLL
jgi:pullulanase/glycogen debranching enzyme